MIVTNYLWRPLFPRILDALDEGGVLLYDTFARGNEAYGRPSNPDFLLEAGFRQVGDVLALMAG